MKSLGEMLSALVYHNLSPNHAREVPEIVIFCLIVCTTIHLSMKFKLTSICGFYETTIGRNGLS